MAKIVISCDSTADLSKELLERYNVEVFPLTIVRGEETLKDGVDVTQKDVFEYKAKTGKLLTTSAPNIAECEDYLTNLKEKYGSDAQIVHFDISSDFSSSYSNVLNSSEDFEDVFVVDSRNLSTGIGLLVLRACDLRDKGLSGKEIFDDVNQTKLSVDASFVLDTLEYLHKGGRCSGVAALGANLLKLKPCIEVRDGKMGVGKKYRGKLIDSLKNYVNDALHDADDIITDRVFVTHTMDEDKMDMVNEIAELVKSIVPFKEVLITRAGCSVSVHCGPNTLGVLFIRKSVVTKE